MDYPAYYKQMKFHQGDNLQWMDPQYNDARWQTTVPVISSDHWWLRLPLKATFKPKNGAHAGLAISLHGSYQIFWDRVLIGENGKWGNTKKEEVEGKRNNYFLIPDSLLSDSVHFLALRISSFYDTGRRVFPNFSVGNYFNLVRSELKSSVLFFLLAGVFLVISLYYFFLFFISLKYVPYFLFAILCFCFFTMIMLEYLKAYYQYPYSFHFKRLFAIGVLAFLIGNVLSLFLLFRFQLKHKVTVILLLNILLFAGWFIKTGYDDKTKAISVIAFTVALFISLVAIINNRKGSTEAFYGVLACLSCHVNYDLMVYVGFSLLVLFMLISLSKQMKEQVKSEQEALLRSKRLEIELLKKNIQPHFLMNSLTALMEWVERSPGKSIEFINALANEFSILNSISSEKLITVEQELELCKSHLEIMSYRKDIEYSLQTNNIDLNEKIPPAVLLTLIENGISHNIIEVPKAVFILNFSRNNGCMTYSLLVPGKVEKNNSTIEKGTGLKYIETRLEESFPKKWKLTSEATDQGWETKISILD